MPKSQHLPRLDRISILAATILLTYLLARFIDFPSQAFSVQLPGAYLTFSLTVNTVIAVFVIGLTGSGVDWLLREHPMVAGKPTYQHWLLPTLTAWAIGNALIQQPLGPLWWAGFILGSSFIIMVVIAEYITVDPEDVRRIPATMGLTAVSFALYLMLAVTMRVREARLFIIVPTMTLAIGLVSLRVLHLQLGGHWAWVPTALVMLIIGQLTAAFHYLPLSPTAFALALVGPAYAVINLASGVLQGKGWRQLIFEPTLALALSWGFAIWSG